MDRFEMFIKLKERVGRKAKNNIGEIVYVYHDIYNGVQIVYEVGNYIMTSYNVRGETWEIIEPD